jgi:serine protease Do
MRAFLALLSLLLAPPVEPFTREADATAEKLAALESRFRDSLVSLRYRQRVSRSTFEPPEEEELSTTGLIVSREGLILTSALVFEPFNQVPHGVGIRFPASVGRGEAEVASARVRTVGGSEFPASLSGRDFAADVAFFQIDAPGGAEFVPVELGKTRPVTVGEELAVVSLLPEPLGPAISVELTRVQAVTDSPRPGFVVGTAASDPVGGLVTSLSGEVLGYLDALTVAVPDTSSRNPLAFVTMMRDLPKGIGRAFARPASELSSARAEARASAPVRRGWLGVEMQAVSRELANHLKLPTSSGVLVGYVYPGSPAGTAGLKVGDVLVALDGNPVNVQRDDELGSFAERILRAGADAVLSLEYLRNGERLKTTARLAPAPRSIREALTLKVDELDLTVREVTYDFVATRFLPPDQPGVVVVQPPLGVSGNQNRIVPGDLLVRVGDESVADFAGFRELVGRIRERKPEEVMLFVERGRETFFFAVKPDWN